MEAEAVEIVGGVVGGDDEKGVGVGDRLGEQFVDEDVHRRRRPQRQEEERNDHEMPGGIRGIALHPQAAHRWPAEVEDAPHREGCDRHFPAAPMAAIVEDAEGIGGVVDDLPGAGDDGDQRILEGHRDPHPAEKLQMPLGDVRVAILAGVVVVEDVVFVVPGLGEEPVKPIDIPPPPPGKPLARVAVGNPRHAVVAAVEDVVGEEPPGELPEAQTKGTDRIGDHPSGGVAEARRHPPIPLDPPQMAVVGRTDGGVGLGPDPVDALTEASHIDPAEIPGRGLQTDAHADGPWWGRTG